MGQIEVFSPAKINLFLSVLGRMENGFHELVSLVSPVDFGDRISIEVEEALQPSVSLVCDDEGLPTDASNLAFAAAELFLTRRGLSWRAQLRLEKRIPCGAGLGGGSSNAAAVLLGLNRLVSGSAEDKDLLEMAAELGSDCPLFLRGRSVVMRGRGELLEDIAPSALQRLSGKCVLLFKPSFSVATPWAFAALAATSGAYGERTLAEERLRAWQSGDLSLADLLDNTFESVIFAKYPAFSALSDRFAQAGFRLLLSGSGSCCYSLLDTKEDEGRLTSIVREAWGKGAFVRACQIL